MAVLVEGDLQLTVEGSLVARKFDNDSHGLSHCMKAVDFIVELPELYLFIEFKDPDNPRSRAESRQEFLRELLSGEMDEDLKYKCRDSFLYEWASGRADKPIRFYVLVALASLSEANLQARTEELRRKLPTGIPAAWSRSIIEDCAVFNIQSWNRFLPGLSVSRASVP